MKKILIYIMLFAGLTSCDSWIQLEPENAVTYTNFYKNEKDAEALIVSCMIRARVVVCNSSSAHPSLDIGIGELVDNITNARSPKLIEARQLSPIGISEGNGNSSMVWSNNYGLIHAANVIIDNAYRFRDNKAMAETRLQFYLMQAHFFKAYGYFAVARTFGNAPIPTTHTDTKIIGRSPVHEVLMEAIRCAEIAYGLPEWNKMTDNIGRPITTKQWASKGMAAALLANIYAWKGALENNLDDTKKAVDYCTEIIEGKAGTYAMHTSPKQLCEEIINKRHSSGAIWEIELSQTESAYGYTGQTYPSGRAFKSFPLDTLMTRTSIPLMSLNATTVNNLYEEKDLRRTEFFYEIDKPVEGINEENRLAFPYKFREAAFKRPTSGKDYYLGLDINRIVWRMADIVLLRAECRNRAGMSGAIADLNQIRGIAGATLYPGAPGDGDDMKVVIFREREKELIFEWERYYDVVRNGLWNTHMNPTYPHLTDADVKNGALYMPLYNNPSTGEYTNHLLIQYPFWNGRR